MEKLRHWEMRELAQGYTISKMILGFKARHLGARAWASNLLDYNSLS